MSTAQAQMALSHVRGPHGHGQREQTRDADPGGSETGSGTGHEAAAPRVREPTGTQVGGGAGSESLTGTEFYVGRWKVLERMAVTAAHSVTVPDAAELHIQK